MIHPLPSISSSLITIFAKVFSRSLLLPWWMVLVGAQEEGDPTITHHPLGVVPKGVLSNGLEIPLVGLGCASGVRTPHVASALRLGYRFLDTAQSYSWGYHEDEVGSALHTFWHTYNQTSSHHHHHEDSPSGHGPVWVQTKIHPQDLGYHATKRAVEASLQRLQVDSIDSVLIHKPRCWKEICPKAPEGTWQDSWKALEEFYHQGTIQALGICDVTETLLDELLEQEIPPHIIQNWMDPIHQDKVIRQRCQEHGIQYQAYSSLGSQWIHHRGYQQNPVLENPTLLRLAQKYQVAVPQIILRWATGHGISVLPASTKEEHQRANLLDSFDFQLTPQEIASIDALDGQVPNRPTKNPEAVSIQFENPSELGKHVDLFWYNPNEESEVKIQTNIPPGDSVHLESFHGHEFVYKDSETGMHLGRHVISKHNGKQQKHVILGNEDEL